MLQLYGDIYQFAMFELTTLDITIDMKDDTPCIFCVLSDQIKISHSSCNPVQCVHVEPLPRYKF